MPSKKLEMQGYYRNLIHFYLEQKVILRARVNYDKCIVQ